jgi:hypothetical protein
MSTNVPSSRLKTMKYLIMLMKLSVGQKRNEAKARKKKKYKETAYASPVDNRTIIQNVEPKNNDYEDFKKYIAFKNATSSFSNIDYRTPTDIPSYSNSEINQRKPPQIITKTKEQISLDIIQTQIDALLSTDVNSLSTIMTIDYFNKVLDLLNSLKDDMNTDDVAMRDRLILMLQVIFSFINSNKTNLNLKQNMTDISYKYNNIVDKLYPNNHNIQPLNRVIELNIDIDPIYDLYIQRYGLPSGNFFDNSKILELKSEFSI